MKFAARAMLIALVLQGAAAVVCSAAAAPAHGSVLAFPLVVGRDQPDLVLAQRTIDRHWGPSDDSTYHEVSISGWKSEGGAFAMSLLLPGAGQLYVGERSGYLFLVTEAVCIYEVRALTRSAGNWDHEARAWAGDPADARSRWSFDTYQKQSPGSTASLRALYAADPSLFYFAIGEQSSLGPGWVDHGGTDESRQQFVAWRDNAEERRRRARSWSAAIWVNHAVAAFEALRAARLLNLPLRQSLDLRLKSGWNRGGPQVMAALERTF